MIEIRRYDGAIEFRRVVGRADSLLLGTPFGMVGGMVAIRNNVMADSPVVVLVQP